MKFSVSSYSYAQLTESGRRTLFGCIDLAAESGFDGIEFTDLNPPQGIDVNQYADDLRTKCRDRGLTIVCYTVGADFLTGSDGDLDAEIARVKAQVDIAEILGVKLMRHDATRGFADGTRGSRGFDQALPRVIEGCRAVTEYARKKGIRTMIENHGFFCQDSDRVERVVNGVADDNFGLLVDIGNFLCADEDPVHAVSRLAPYAFHVHAKDFHVKPGTEPLLTDGYFRTRGGNYLRGAIVGHGDAKAAQSLRILKNSGYDGWITVEFEGIEDPELGTKYGLNTLRRIFGILAPIEA